MGSRALVLVPVIAAMIGTASAAGLQDVRVVKQLDGYMCMRTVQSEEDKKAEMAGPPFTRFIWGSAPVFQSPSFESKQLGIVESEVIVKKPFDPVNGFVEVLRMNGQRGWVQADKLAPLRSGEFIHSGPMYPVFQSNGYYLCASERTIRADLGKFKK